MRIAENPFVSLVHPYISIDTVTKKRLFEEATYVASIA